MFWDKRTHRLKSYLISRRISIVKCIMKKIYTNKVTFTSLTCIVTCSYENNFTVARLQRFSIKMMDSNLAATSAPNIMRKTVNWTVLDAFMLKNENISHNIFINRNILPRNIVFVIIVRFGNQYGVIGQMCQSTYSYRIHSQKTIFIQNFTKI